MRRETCVEDLCGALAVATEQVLETMFFTTIEGRLEAPPEAERAVAAVLSFRGEISGIFRLDLSAGSARRIAASFLADEPEALSPERVGEAVCELANMICGRTLSEMHSEKTFELLSPHLETAPVPEAAGVAHIFQLGDGYIRVSLQIR